MKKQHLFEWIQLGANIATIAAVFFIWWQTNINQGQIKAIREERKFNRTLQLAELIDRSMLELTSNTKLQQDSSYTDKITEIQRIICLAVQLGTCLKENRINPYLISPLITRHGLNKYRDYAYKIIDSKPIEQRTPSEANTAQSLLDYITFNSSYLDELANLNQLNSNSGT